MSRIRSPWCVRGSLDSEVMSQSTTISVTCLGQSGFRFAFPGAVTYIDPYLSDRVAELEGPELRRQVPLPVAPGEIRDAQWVLVTHAHLDHCDLATVVPLAKASPQARFVCPNVVRPFLRDAGIGEDRLVAGREQWIGLAPGLRVHPVPAVHPTLERDAQGCSHFLGYVLEWNGRRLYHAGDTSLDQRLLDGLEALKPIDVAFLPVNERNFYRERRGIIGNMGLRDAFGFAADLEVRTLVPMHWDMFAPNSVYPEEIELLFKLMNPPFGMVLRPDHV